MAHTGRGLFINQVLTPIKLPNVPKSGERAEGHEEVHEWQLTTEVIIAMRVFLRAVEERRLADIVEFIRKLMASGDAAENHSAHELAAKLCSHECEAWKEALLTSILTGSRPLVEFVLQLFHQRPEAEQTGCEHSAAFPPHVKPLLLACLCNNFGIVECLLLRGHQLELPHRFDCYCRECKNLATSGRGETPRLDAYRAASSEAFLWLATDDPMLAAMHMLKDLEASPFVFFFTAPLVQESQKSNSEHRELYAGLYDQVQTFTTSLVRQCWSFEEVDCLLKQKNGAEFAAIGLSHPRVRMALDCKMKEFASHVAVQSLMKTQWVGGWTDRGRSYTRDAWRGARHLLLFPVLALLHAVSGGRWIGTFAFPRARFMTHAAAYAAFVLLIASIRFSGNRLPDAPVGQRALLASEGLVFVYVAGLLVDELLEYLRRGSRYFEQWWRLFVLLQIFVFTLAFVCRLAAFNDAALDRRHLPPLHPALFFDFFFGAACLLTVGRALYFAQLHRTLGSTIISIGRCLFQIVNYFGIMTLVMFAFAVAVNTIQQPYTRPHSLGGDEAANRQKLLFGDLVQSMRHLFWAFYGYLNPVDYELPAASAHSNEAVAHTGVEFLVAVYYVVMVISLLNLMISLLVKRAHEVLDNEEVEWKFTRLQIYSEHLEATSAVPPPFNLLFLVVLAVKRAWSGDWAWSDLNGFVERQFLHPDEDAVQEDFKYKQLLCTLFRRYVHSKHFHYTTTALVEKSGQNHASVKTMFMAKRA